MGDECLANLLIDRHQQLLEPRCCSQVGEQILGVLESLPYGMQILRRQQEEFFPLQTGGVDLGDHPTDMLRVSPQTGCQSVDKPLPAFEALRFDDHNEGVEFVKIFVNVLEALDITGL